MLPIRSRADHHLAAQRVRELHAEAARRRLAGEVPAVYRGRDWGVSRHRALIMLLGVGLLALILLRPWAAQAPAGADAPVAATVVAGQSARELTAGEPPAAGLAP